MSPNLGRTTVAEMIQAQRQDSQNQRATVRFPNDRFLEVHRVPLPDGSEIHTFTDVTKRHENEIELRNAKEAAEAATNARSSFLAKMSHEIRTPLNGVIGLTSMLADTRLDAIQSRYVKNLHHSADHLLQLISDVLDFSKLEAEHVELEETSFDLAELVESVQNILMPRFLAKGLEFRCAIADDVPRFLQGDPGRIRQILLNLAGNGVKFTHIGGVALSVSVSVEKTTDPVIGLDFMIDDTGIGIAEDAIENLFQQFHQIDRSITRRYGGTGLGLVISKQLACLMGGDIMAQSKLGQGSRFIFSVALPQAPEEFQLAAPTPMRSLDKILANKKLSILLAEDNRTNQLVATAILETTGCRVHCVANGIEAVEAVKQRPYDLILMDLMMPEMDGIEATHAIKQYGPPLSDIPIIALTANSLTQDREICLQAGMAGFVTKPFNATKLANAINEVFEDNQPVSMATLDEMRTIYGQALPRFATLFLTETQSRIERMSNFMQNKDTQSLWREAHTLKGASVTFGCTSLGRCAEKLESAAHGQTGENLASLFDAIEVAFDVSSKTLAAEIPQHDDQLSVAAQA